MLPARDGVAHGGIERSAPAPNCSFYTHWTATDDAITWDVDVATSGRYEAVVYYTCAKENVGSTIELGFHGSRVETRVTVPHDPPLMGAERDRVPRRGESYVKDFRPLRIGKIQLEQGRGPLTLRAREIPGEEIMDVRLVTLTLMPQEAGVTPQERY